MKLKSEKGFTLIDITVAIIVILAFMSLISVIFFNITKTSKGIERESEATFIATSVIEDVKSQEYDNVRVTNQGILNENVISSQNGTNINSYTYIDGKKVNVTLTDGYTCILTVQNYVPSNRTEANTDLVKLILVSVSYKLGGEVKTVELKTSIVNDNY